MYEGQIITYKVKILPGVWVPWVTEIKAVDEGKSFVDEQRFGRTNSGITATPSRKSPAAC